VTTGCEEVPAASQDTFQKPFTSPEKPHLRLSFKMVNDIEEQQLKARAERIRVAVRCCPGRACHASISHNRTSFTMQRPKTTLKKQLGDFEKIFDEEDGGE
jgi:hypothetical protein